MTLASSVVPAHVRVILNPSAAGGAALGKVAELETALRRYELQHEIVLTRAAGHASELARAAAADDVDVIAVVGGDGTLNEVVQAYVDANGACVKGPDLALIPCGTGGDFKRTLGLSGAIDEAVGRIRHGSRKSVDLGVLRFHANDVAARSNSYAPKSLDASDSSGAPSAPKSRDSGVRAFVNVASFGIGGAVDAIVNASRSRMGGIGGRAAFFLATLRAMASYKNASVRIRVDGALWYEGAVFNVAIANGRFHGGGMMIAPHADPSDGRFEVVAIADLGRASVLAMTPKIYRGSHLAEDGVLVTRGTHIEAEGIFPWASVLMDVDGEQLGELPLQATMHAGALTFRV